MTHRTVYLYEILSVNLCRCSWKKIYVNITDYSICYRVVVVCYVDIVLFTKYCNECIREYVSKSYAFICTTNKTNEWFLCSTQVQNFRDLLHVWAIKISRFLYRTHVVYLFAISFFHINRVKDHFIRHHRIEY